jgi:hypothetical protein
MTKFFGWAIILFTGSFLLILASSLLFVVEGIAKGFPTMKTKELVLMTLSFSITVALFTIGFIKGLKMIRSPKKWTPPASVEPISFTFTNTISLKEYRSMIFENTLKKSTLTIAAGILLFVVIGIFNSNENDSGMFKFIALGIIISFLLIPLLTLSQAKKFYESNKALNEKIAYTIDNEKVTIQGESFNAECNWDHFIKMKETKGFFMLFEGNTTAMLINKAALDQEQTKNLRALLISKLPM